MANILNRFADINDLKVALPTGKLNRFRWPIPFHLSAVDVSRLDGDNPSILVSHARYHRTTFELIMRKGAKYITILRNPVDQYESTFNYMEFGRRLQLQGKSKYPLEDFMKNPVKILHKMRNHEKHRQIPDAIALVKNPMFFDLGKDLFRHNPLLLKKIILREELGMHTWHVRLNFDLGKRNKMHHHSSKEHLKISKIAKFGCQIL